ncbi:hypothetical protein ACMATS_36200 [Streptoverticillium reticulum]|uniref:hypothetical protein n=1 Tax=Streptoverticillium reticulum TaxID=1433415 RepID=UPI0039BF3B07
MPAAGPCCADGGTSTFSVEVTTRALRAAQDAFSSAVMGRDLTTTALVPPAGKDEPDRGAALAS